MQLFRILDRDQKGFVAAPEIAMDFQFGKSEVDSIFYFVLGCRVAVPLNRETFIEPKADYLNQPWLNPSMSAEGRWNSFQGWFDSLDEVDGLAAVSPEEAWGAFLMALTVTPIGTLPSSPVPPPSIYGHLLFATTTVAETVIYRWEAFPKSRRIDSSVSPPTIAKDTYAAPASETPFAPTGFAAVARFALPNVMPACFRYELQPMAGTLLECGASVPLYGQSGGGVEVKFTAKTDNRCPIADPIILSPL